MVPAPKKKVLVIGGQFSGTFTARCLKKQFDVTVVDAKEYFEYTPGILRAYVKPCHLDALTFLLEPVIQRSMRVNFVLGEVLSLTADKTALVKPMTKEGTETYAFDYCVICSGCNFGMLSKIGESLWFPTIHEKNRPQSAWSHIDERFLEGRRRHILEEYHTLAQFNKDKAKILVVGAGFIGVEWITELQHYFPNLKLTIVEFLSQCLGPLPARAARYCNEYMKDHGIDQFYEMKFDANDASFWTNIGMPEKADKIYECVGVKASNYFMPPETLSDKGPGGGGWIHFNEYLQVVHKDDQNKTWCDGVVFAVGDCNLGCIGKPGKPVAAEPGKKGPAPPTWDGPLPVIPKISYPGEEQAMHAVNNVKAMLKAGEKGKPRLKKTWWPWGAGMFATSLGPHDACFVLAANEKKGSGYMVNWWYPAALQKEIIESTKINECRDCIIGKMIWHFVHHTPFNLWGRGPLCP